MYLYWFCLQIEADATIHSNMSLSEPDFEASVISPHPMGRDKRASGYDSDIIDNVSQDVSFSTEDQNILQE